MRFGRARDAAGRRAGGARQGADVAPVVVDLRDETQLCAAYRAHGDELYRLCLRSLRDPAAAQDCVQETFLRAWRAADTYDPARGGLRGWLFTIARNVLVDAARRAASRPDLQLVADDVDGAFDALDGTDGGPSLEDRLMDEWVVEEALRRISPDHRVAVVETHLKGRSAAEVADDLGVPVGTVRSRVYYGLRSLRVALDEMGVEL